MKVKPLPPIARFLKWHWQRMKDNELRLVFPPSQDVFSGIRKSGQYLWVDPGGFRPSFSIDFGKDPNV